MADKLLSALDKRIKSLESDVKSLEGTVKSLEADVKRLTLENKGLTAMVAKAPDQKDFIKDMSDLRSEKEKLAKIMDMENRKAKEKYAKMAKKMDEQAKQATEHAKELVRQSQVESRLKILEGIVSGLTKR